MFQTQCEKFDRNVLPIVNQFSGAFCKFFLENTVKILCLDVFYMYLNRVILYGHIELKNLRLEQ